MCGIVGYTGHRQAGPILLEGLSKLEYRGYDSAGIAVRDGQSRYSVVKAKGRLLALAEKTDNGMAIPGTCGIGHTRWATHGEPTEINAHPHVSGDIYDHGITSDESNVVGVHNGIIENYQELKEKLVSNGYVFYSQTDTEVAVKLVDYYYKKYGMGPIDALAKTMVRVRGSYALAVMFRDHPGEIYTARKDSPMIIGVGDGETFIASDATAIISHTRKVFYVDNLEMACLTPGKAVFYNLNGDVVEKTASEITWDAQAAEKEGYEHFMIKEIHEQPKAVADTMRSVLANGHIDLKDVGVTEEMLHGINKLYIVACGSSWHVGLACAYVFEGMARLETRVDLASEFRYRNPILGKDTLVILISQSGETADTLAALREAKEQGAMTLGIVNVVGSSIAREADAVFYTKAGPEIAVATTKAYSSQLVACYALAIGFAQARGTITDEQHVAYVRELETLPDKIGRILNEKERLQWFASKFCASHDIFYIGRGIDYAVCLEGSLKMKEISYIHSEAYAAGELKHGTISLLDKGMPVLGVLTQDTLYEKTVSNLVECKARGAFLCALTTYGHYEMEDTADFVVYIPRTDAYFAASLAIVPLQLLGYYVSIAKGLDVDKPRNLAKSVTVE